MTKAILSFVIVFIVSFIGFALYTTHMQNAQQSNAASSSHSN